MEVLLQQLVNALALGGTYALLALGVAIVFSIMGLVNFAHGELLTITGYTLFFLAGTLLPVPAVIAIGILAAAAAALAMERIAFRPFRGASGTTLLLTSFAVSVIIQILFQILIDPRGKPVPVAAGLNRLVDIFGVRIALLQIICIAASVALLAAMTLFLSRTTLGISVRAAAQDFEVARLMGVRANAVVATVFVVSGLLAGVAGVLWVAQRSIVDPFMGLPPVLVAFVAAVVGGLGSLGGAVAAAYLLGFIEIMVRAFLPDEFQPLRQGVVWVVVIGVLLLRPSGLFQRSTGARA
jgi:branched-chain amino acid transport system permease protein